jgi:HEAT repeat protein
MGKRSGVIFGIFVAMCMVVVCVVCLYRRKAEPVYKGEPLSYWLQCYDGQMPTGLPNANREAQANEAIKAVGANAIPTLLRLLDWREPRWKGLLRALEARIGVNKIPNTLAPRAVYQVQGAFGTLGSKASNAAPKLIEIYNHNPNVTVKLVALSSLGQIGPAAREAVPALIRIATQPTTNGFMVQYQACHTLVGIHADPELAVPALIKCLEDKESIVRATAAECLGYFGTNARPAVPALIQLAMASGRGAYRDFDPKLSAQISLGKIDPDAAKKAGVEPVGQTDKNVH